MASIVSIRITTASGQSSSYVLDQFGKDLVLLGRTAYHGHDTSAPANDIAVNEGSVSRAQLRFEKRADGWYIVNEGAGIMIGSSAFQQRRIENGDRYVVNPNGSAYACVIDCAITQGEVQQQIPSLEETFDPKRISDMRRMEGHHNAATGQFQDRTISLLDKANYLIGRSPECDICLPHPLVSRQHCYIMRNSNRLVLYDNHSTNGVMINGKMLTAPHALANGDRISIAHFKLTFQDGYLNVTASNGGVSVDAIDVCKVVKDSGKGRKGTKYITDHVSLSIKPGEFVAIIGGSGAGKSTIMNCLSGMTDYTSGQVLVDGEPLNTGSSNVRSIIGYVPQSDIVYDDLSLERMLTYSARLRMPPDTTEEDIKAKINETLDLVQLTEHRKTRIGKLSGGQRKRASMAVELLASPKLFFLDEPFSGLDPGTEKKLMAMLKQLSLTGKTVIMVTHSVQNIELCDRLICMGRGGRLCYSGKPEGALPFFGAATISDIYDGLDNNSEQLAAKFRYQAGVPEVAPAPAPEATRETGKQSSAKTHGFKQFRVVTHRYLELTWNRRGRLFLLLIMPVILTLFVCIAFGLDGGLNLGLYHFFKDTFDWEFAGLYERVSYPFASYNDTLAMVMTFACAAFWIGIFNSIQEISKERTIYNREAFTGLRPLPYLSSKIVINFFLCLIQAVIMVSMLVAVSSYTVSYDGTEAGKTLYNITTQAAKDMGDTKVFEVTMAEKGQVISNMWGELFITTFLSMLSAMALGLVVSAAVSNDLALVLCPIALLPQILFSGVTSVLHGFSETFSNIITCRWSVIGFGTSLDLNGQLDNHFMYQGIGWTDQYNAGYSASQIVTSTDEMFWKPEYSDKFFFDLFNGTQASWFYIGLLTVACVGISLFILYRNGRGYNSLSVLNGRRAHGKRH